MNETFDTLIALLNIFNTAGKNVKKALKPTIDSLYSQFITGLDNLTEEEIQIGINDGKIVCIRAVRARTGASLVDTKNLCEHIFKGKYAFQGFNLQGEILR